MPNRKETLTALLDRLEAYRESLALQSSQLEDASPEDICRRLAEAQGATEAVKAVLKGNSDPPSGKVHPLRM